MPLSLDHTIVPAKDKEESVRLRWTRKFDRWLSESPAPKISAAGL